MAQPRASSSCALTIGFDHPLKEYSKMNIICDEADKLARKQLASQLACSRALDQLILAAENAKLTSNMNPADALASSDVEKLVSEAQTALKDFHGQVAKMGKAMDNCKAINIDADDPSKGIIKTSSSSEAMHAMNIAILEHLCRVGKIEAADTFAREVGSISEAQLKAMNEPYLEMHHILHCLEMKDLEPALKWAVENRAKLPHKDTAEPSDPSCFEFSLLQLHFVAVLQSQGREGALSFARGHFEPFASSGYPVHRLMGLLAIGATDHGQKRYPDLLSSASWDLVAEEFSKLACGLMGQSKNPPLLVAVAAGSVALPPLMKLGKVMEHTTLQHGALAELPVELDLGTSEFIWHSIFACPVSKEQSTLNNPPCLLPCGHMLCEESVMRIVRARTRTFKCPYCPQESKVEALLRIVGL